MKYRKKPVVIDAVQFTDEMRIAAVLDSQPCPEGVLMGNRSYNKKDRTIRSAEFYIETLEGRMAVNVGDWIITGIKGERYPCKPDIFEATYEKVEGEKS